jgi:muramoyltetrapeptide carboxypeptidase
MEMLRRLLSPGVHGKENAQMAVSLRRPPAVSPGAALAILSPASHPQQQRIERGMEELRFLGYRTWSSEHVYTRGPHYLAGTAQERLSDLHCAFADPEIAAILCTRGGYGMNYLLDGLNLELIASHPKPLFGYSDITCLQVWLLDQVGLPGFHGPMVSADFATKEGVHFPSLSAAISGKPYTVGAPEGLRVLRPGRAAGTLYGGCLTLLTSALGTRHAPHTEGKLLFLEDVGAKPYQVDRMLRHLILAGKLEGVTGIIFGEMLDCASPGAPDSLLEEVILRVLKDFQGPIAIGLRSGHVSHDNVTLLFGIQAELNLEGEPVLNLLEPAVTA